MKFNKWTVGLAAIGVVSLASAARADEKMSSVQTALSNTTLSGYVDTAAIWRPGTDARTAGAGFSGPNIPAQAFSKNDGFYLNSVDLALDHPEDESPWAAGYHAELMFGPDSVPNSNGSPTSGPVGNAANIRQAYVTLRTPVGNGIDWKIGVWDTIVGYESSSDPLNPNYTRSYGYTIEPTTHTGVLATYKISDMFTVQGGIADWSNVGLGGTVYTPGAINGVSAIESQKAYMGDLQFTAPDSAGFMKGATVTLAAIANPGNDTSGAGATSWYIGGTVPTPVTALKAGAAFDYLSLHNGNVPGNSRNDDVWNIALYSTYQATEKLAFNVRGEYLNTEGLSGSQVGGPSDATTIFGANTSAITAGKYGQNKIEELTLTAQYNLWANVISRLELRWDHAEHNQPFGASENAPNGPFRSSDWMMALNVIYQF